MLVRGSVAVSIIFVSLFVLGLLFLLLIWVGFVFVSNNFRVSVGIFRLSLMVFIGVNACLFVIFLAALKLGLSEEMYLLAGNVIFNLTYFLVDYGTLNAFNLMVQAEILASIYEEQVFHLMVILLLELVFYAYVISDRQRIDFYLTKVLVKIYYVFVLSTVLWLIIGGIGTGIFALIQWSLEPFNVFLHVLGYLILGILIVSALMLISLAFEFASRNVSV